MQHELRKVGTSVIPDLPFAMTARANSKARGSALLLGALVAMELMMWPQSTAAQATAETPLQISWEVRNRFRLF